MSNKSHKLEIIGSKYRVASFEKIIDRKTYTCIFNYISDDTNDVTSIKVIIGRTEIYYHDDSDEAKKIRKYKILHYEIAEINVINKILEKLSTANAGHFVINGDELDYNTFFSLNKRVLKLWLTSLLEYKDSIYLGDNENEPINNFILKMLNFIIIKRDEANLSHVSDDESINLATLRPGTPFGSHENVISKMVTLQFKLVTKINTKINEKMKIPFLRFEPIRGGEKSPSNSNSNSKSKSKSKSNSNSKSKSKSNSNKIAHVKNETIDNNIKTLTFIAINFPFIENDYRSSHIDAYLELLNEMLEEKNYLTEIQTEFDRIKTINKRQGTTSVRRRSKNQRIRTPGTRRRRRRTRMPITQITSQKIL
jgi:hypothetical protein